MVGDVLENRILKKESKFGEERIFVGIGFLGDSCEERRTILLARLDVVWSVLER